MRETPDEQQDLLKQIRQGLDQAESALDANTRRDLRQARQRALAQLQTPRRLWQPVGLAAVAASVVALVIGLQVMQTATIETAPDMEDLQLLSTSDDLELYENLEFYQWLEFEARSG